MATRKKQPLQGQFITLSVPGQGTMHLQVRHLEPAQAEAVWLKCIRQVAQVIEDEGVTPPSLVHTY